MSGSSGSRSGVPGKFTQGPTMRHVVVMTLTGSVGLMAVFLVDLLNLFYIAQLGEQELAAAIGYAGTVLFFLTSFAIGVSIAGTALVSRALGAGDREKARRLATSSLFVMAVAMVLLAAAMLPWSGRILSSIGATGRTHAIADRFLWMVVPSTIFLGLGMMYSAILRAVGDAKRAMWVTLMGGIVTAILDPVFIFALGLGVDGAAITSIISRIAMALIGLRGVTLVHRLTAPPQLAAVLGDVKPIAAIAVPAVLTNIATPFGNGIVTAMIARYGDSAVAGWAVLGRLVPVAFGAFFALSGSIGPIMGQNVGARLYPRVRQALVDALVFLSLYGIAVWLILLLLSDHIVRLFDATGMACRLQQSRLSDLLHCTQLEPGDDRHGSLRLGRRMGRGSRTWRTGYHRRTSRRRHPVRHPLHRHLLPRHRWHGEPPACGSAGSGRTGQRPVALHLRQGGDGRLVTLAGPRG
ncbi:MAG: MATE efflux family protein [Xanthobacteraceae bacterium]|nr:MAG: MATE efflux family protein [Xanthobacteraceae bacterium]